MPVTYEIDQARRLIHTRCVGDVTLNEVIEHFDVLAGDPACPDRLDVLLDLSEQMTLPASSQLRLVTRKIEDVSSRVRFGRCAIVATTDAMYGMTRVFGALTEGQFAAVRVFRNIDEARTWLDARH
jgi:hypothetical protein